MSFNVLLLECNEEKERVNNEQTAFYTSFVDVTEHIYQQEVQLKTVILTTSRWPGKYLNQVWFKIMIFVFHIPLLLYAFIHLHLKSDTFSKDLC